MKKRFLCRALGLMLAASLVVTQGGVIANAASAEDFLLSEEEFFEDDITENDISGNDVEDVLLEESDSEESSDSSGDGFLQEELLEDAFEGDVSANSQVEEITEDNEKYYAFPEGTSGAMGNVKWSFSNGTVTISGSGPLPNQTYGKTPWESYKNSITRVVVGDQVTHIGAFAFYGCPNLREVVLGKSVATIGNNAFSYSGLTGITFPEGFKSYGFQAFKECKSLSRVVFKGNKITKCDMDAFNGCSISTVVFPKGITTIPDMLFYGAGFTCNTITIPKTVKSIGRLAFYACDFHEVVFESGSVLKSIGQSAFSCSSVDTINFPSSLTTIDSFAFQDTYLSTVVIPKKVTKIGAGAFWRSYNLYKVVLPASLKNLGGYVFTVRGNQYIDVYVKTGTYAYKWVKKNASTYNYVIVQCGDISYVLRGGKNNPENPTVYRKGEVVNPKNPSRTGYEFKGWFIDSKCTKKATAATFSKGTKITFYAKWAARTYTVNYVATGNGVTLNGDAAYTVKYGKKHTNLKSTASRKGYKFTGWYTQPQGGKKVTKSSVFKPANPDNFRIYAHWTPVRYKITYKLSGGKLAKNTPKSYTTDKGCVIPAPTRKGYNFAGWQVVSTKAQVSFSGNTIPGGQGNCGNVTLKALWTKK